MRSMILVLALSAPSLAFATPNYTSPINNVPSAAKAAKPQRVTVSFFNSTLNKCRVHIGEASYTVAPFEQIKLEIAVGSKVKVDSEMNSKIAQTMQASASDDGRQVFIQ